MRNCRATACQVHPVHPDLVTLATMSDISPVRDNQCLLQDLKAPDIISFLLHLCQKWEGQSELIPFPPTISTKRPRNKSSTTSESRTTDCIVNRTLAIYQTRALSSITEHKRQILHNTRIRWEKGILYSIFSHLTRLLLSNGMSSAAKDEKMIAQCYETLLSIIKSVSAMDTTICTHDWS